MPTYTNPVYPYYFADPFVLEHEGSYYAYGTGEKPIINGKIFEVLHSTDLIHWTLLGGCLTPLEPYQYHPSIAHEAELDYWAPEVAFDGENFYMYYSVGWRDERHAIHVAKASRPEGPFTEVGTLTPHELFAIDASPFRDDDGQWYLFYARDFLEDGRIGTALGADRLVTMTQLENTMRTVLRASSDWQIYERNRNRYGKVYDWHTLEGPFVIKRNGKYFCLYSGGDWRDKHYGVSYAVADHPLGPWREPYEGSATLLKTLPDEVLGPGHNSVVKAPNGDDYIIYHAWDAAKTARRLCIDRLEWKNGEPTTIAPTFTEQVMEE
jgi:beta-xylosidase